MMFDLNELNQIGQLIDIALRANGVQGLKFVPLLEKCEREAQRLTQPQDDNPPGGGLDE